jgi:DNA-binding transcriptional ArsR family regulator
MVADRRDGTRRSPERDAEGAFLRGERGGRVDGAPADFDRLIHERIRLGIVSALAVNERLTFSELKAIVGATDGNLSVHARKLEEAGYLECNKGFQGRTPRTEYRLTSPGREALARYLDHMEALIEAVRES